MQFRKLRRATGAIVWALLFCALAALSSCSSLPDNPSPAQLAEVRSEARPPRIKIDPLRGTASTELTVMTYNVAGLPWPIKKGRRRALKEIAREVRALHAAGRAPDVLVLQEAFTAPALAIGEAYPNRLRGPLSSDRSKTDAPQISEEFRRARRFDKGERSGKVLSSGLYVLSDFPIAAAYMTPFRRTSCAGYDCLANKGAMIAVIDVPGAPEPVQILNTHLNSKDKSGVSSERSLAAHHQQVDEMGALMARAVNRGWPFIYAGDFNTRHAPDRFDHNAQRLPGVFVRQHCLQPGAGCETNIAWEGDEAPWLRTQDLQGFTSGSKIDVRPLRAGMAFDKPVNGRKLSDHDAYVVTYRLTWKLDTFASVDPAATDSAAAD